MIVDILEDYGIKNLNDDRDKDRLAVLLNDDSLLFKRILRLALHRKLEKFFKTKISYSDSVERLIPRASRPALVYELESDLTADFPKMVLSERRIITIALIYVISFAGISSVYIAIGEFSFYPGFLLYLALVVTIPSFVLGVASITIPRFFAPLDWDDISSVEDLLYRLVVDNYSFFSENNYAQTIKEIDEIYRSGGES